MVRHLFPVEAHLYNHVFVVGPSNHYVTEGQHAEAFTHNAGKTHVVGLPVPAEQIWQAKGRRCMT